MKRLIILTTLCFLASITNAQQVSKVDSIYEHALKLYDSKDLTNAITEFEKVLALNPRHTDALFNLAALQYEQGNKQKAIELFQRSAALGDNESKDILKNKLNVRLAYADTMDVVDVDKQPQLIIEGKQEELFFNKTINNKLLSVIGEKIAKSEEIKSRVFEVEAANKNIKQEEVTQVKFNLGLLFGKDGSITAIPAEDDFSDRKLIIELLKVSPQLGKVTVGSYDNKAVCTRYYAIPLMFYK